MSRRLSQFDAVVPTGTDYVVGYRPGQRGIRSTLTTLASVLGGLVGSVTSAFGQTGNVTRLFLVADDGTRHEITLFKVQLPPPFDGAPAPPAVYELRIDQSNTPS